MMQALRKNTGDDKHIGPVKLLSKIVSVVGMLYRQAPEPLEVLIAKLTIIADF